MIGDALQFYTAPGVMTDPGEYKALFTGLPAEIPALVRVVQGLLLPPLVSGLYEVELSSMQRKEVNVRPVREMLRLISELDDRPLSEPRPARDRLAGSGRDYAVLLCAMLRSQGTPARVRAGFAPYLSREREHTLHADHWVTEYWDAAAGRWVMVDAQIDERQRAHFAIEFDTLDLQEAAFYLAGRAWQECRAGRARSGSFGHSTKQRGWGFMRNSLLLDLAALNKIELLPMDMWWELGTKKEEAVTPDERRLFDELASLTLEADARFEQLRAAYEEDERIHLPVRSHLRLLDLDAAAPGRAGGGQGFQRTAGAAAALPGQAAPGSVRSAGGGLAFTGRLAPGTGIDPAAIVVRGAQQHNLKNVDVTIPRNKLVVLTGVSGSGKSSLAFDTLYAEGQRRYVESLSAYVRRYMEQMDKPKVETISGLSPAISIEQKSISKNPRSTVGTVTEVLDYLRVLFSRAGLQHCPQCGRAVEPHSAQMIADRLAAMPAGTRFQILSPAGTGRKGSPVSLLENYRKAGFTRARVNGQVVELTEKRSTWPEFPKSGSYNLELVIDRLIVPDRAAGAQGNGDHRDWDEFRVRLIDSVETALGTGKGVLRIDLGDGSDILLTEHNACPYCEISLPKLSATLFSFNSPVGMCPECHGLGTQLEVDPSLVVERPDLSLLDGASRWYGNLRKKKARYWLGNLEAMARHYGVDLDKPWQELPEKFRQVVLYGSGEEKLHFTYQVENGDTSWKGESVQPVRGIIYHVKRLFRQTKSDTTRRWYASFMSQQPCPACGGARLRAEARNVTVGGKTLPEVTTMTIRQAHEWVIELGQSLTAEQVEVMGEVLKELHDRLQFMLNVGLHYLTLDRPAPTLSGGEGQRIRLASQLGCGLVGVLYILDEPSIGLHARDQRALLDTLINLRDMGNTVLVVEHDAETMLAADWLIDLGPGAGVLGGEVVAVGTPQQVAANPNSLTGRYLAGLEKITSPNAGRREPSGWLTLSGARLFNLRSLTARFPLGVFTCVTGVSGSGKSSLVAETLYPALMRQLHNAQATPGPYDRLEGLEQLDKVIHITQEAIGRTPRSNPATYAGVFDEIRRVFASTPEARMRGYHADRFSFNVKGGRCEACKGHGQKRVEMHFLPDVWVACQECKGARYNRHTLEIKYKGKNIAQVLDMDVQEALEFFSSYPKISRVLQTLYDVGLEYVKLGQSATTLSGGEAQRVKLAKELSRVATGRTIYILDEPTTGLHFADIQRLLDVLHRLVEAGNTVIVIEHNLDVIRSADWLIDLGPEGGAGGGMVVAEGTPEQVAEVEASHTGRALRAVLAGEGVAYGKHLPQ